MRFRVFIWEYFTKLFIQAVSRVIFHRLPQCLFILYTDYFPLFGILVGMGLKNLRTNSPFLPI